MHSDKDLAFARRRLSPGKGKPELAVEMALYPYAPPFPETSDQISFHITVKGMRHPWYKKAFPDGYNYMGDEIKNPALVPAGNALAEALKSMVMKKLHDHLLIPSADPIYFEDKMVRTPSNDDGFVLSLDFNPHHRPSGIKASPQELQAFFKDVEATLDTITPAITRKMEEHAHLQPSADPEPFMVEAFRKHADRARSRAYGKTMMQEGEQFFFRDADNRPMGLREPDKHPGQNGGREPN